MVVGKGYFYRENGCFGRCVIARHAERYRSDQNALWVIADQLLDILFNTLMQKAFNEELVS